MMDDEWMMDDAWMMDDSWMIELDERQSSIVVVNPAVAVGYHAIQENDMILTVK